MIEEEKRFSRSFYPCARVTRVLFTMDRDEDWMLLLQGMDMLRVCTGTNEGTETARRLILAGMACMIMRLREDEKNWKPVDMPDLGKGE